MLIDIHTHKIKNPDALEIVNISIMDKINDLEKFPCSIGIHPWDCNEKLNVTEDYLYGKLTNRNCLAIGECGLDRVKNKINFQIQLKVFKIQLELAEKLNKPIIVHCVKAYSDILGILKNHKITKPLIFHNYNGNEEITGKLLEFNSFFSFPGINIKNSKKFLSVIRIAGLERIFFETDSSDDFIEEVYVNNCFIAGEKKENMEKIMEYNFRNLFRVDS